MTKEIDDFIKNIEVFEIAKSGIELLTYAASQPPSKNLAQFEELLTLANEAQKILLITIFNELEITPQKTVVEVEKIAQNLQKIMAIIKNISAEIPSELELRKMLESCAESYSSTKINNVFLEFKKNPQKFSPQILFLDELCQRL